MITTNLVELAEAIGSYLEICDAMSQKEYMNQILNDAHGKALERFHERAAAMGKSLAHMYEYGTVPIHDIPKGGRMMTPFDAEARLWIDRFEGGGGVKDISFDFRPAIRANPKKKAKDYGVAQNVLDNLAINRGTRKYVFNWRARVTELGEDVTVERKHAGDYGKGEFVFVPTDIEGDQDGMKGGPGFQWAESSTWTPGASDDPKQSEAGSFSTLFAGYWNTEGANIMAESMETSVFADLAEAEKLIQSGVSSKMLPAGKDLLSAAKAAGAKTRKQWTVRIRENEYEVLERGEKGDIIL